MDSYTRYRRARTSDRRRIPIGIPIVVLVVVALAALIAFSPFGESVREKWIDPVIALALNAVKPKTESVTQAMSNITPSPSEEPTALPIQSETILLSSRPYYILQMGEYRSESDALLAATELMSMGGGGYVYETEGVFRLFVAAYTDAASLQTVQQQIRKDGFVNESYITDVNTVQITLHGVQNALELFKQASDTMERIPGELCELSLNYDKETEDRQSVKSKLAGELELVEKAIKELARIDSEDVNPIKNTLTEYQKAISTFLTECDTINEKMYAGALKHLQLEVILAYTDFFEGTFMNG